MNLLKQPVFWSVLAVSMAWLGVAGAETAEGPARSELVERLKAGERQTIVLYGTSLTRGSRWFKPVEERLERAYPGQLTVINSAGSGRNSRWGLTSLEERVLAHGPDCVFIEFAVNDSVKRFNLTPSEAGRNLIAMVEKIRAANPRCEIILQTMHPVVGFEPDHASFRDQQMSHNELYRYLARHMRLVLIDHFPNWFRLLEEEGLEAYHRLMPDKVHPTAAGYRKVVVPTLLRELGLEPIEP